MKETSIKFATKSPYTDRIHDEFIRLLGEGEINIKHLHAGFKQFIAANELPLVAVMGRGNLYIANAGRTIVIAEIRIR